MNYQTLTLLSLLMFMSPFASSSAEENVPVPVQATFNIVNHSGAKMYLQPFAEPDSDFSACGHITHQENFPIPNGESGKFTLALDVPEPSCFAELIELASMTEKPTVLAYPVHLYRLNYLDQKIQLDSMDVGFGLQAISLDDNAWDLKNDKEFTVTIKNISKSFLTRSKSTATLTIQNKSSYSINLLATTPQNNDGRYGMAQPVSGKTIIPSKQSATIKIHTSANGSAYATVDLLTYTTIDGELTLLSLLEIPIDVGPDFGTPVNEAFAVDILHQDDDARKVKAAFDNTVWDGKKNKKFTLTVQDAK